MKTADSIKQDIMVEIYSMDRKGALPERILTILTTWKEDICKKQREKTEKQIIDLIRNDSFAITFQTMRSYRTGLLRTIISEF